MKERPILFSAPMVRAILAGTKTQTRRVVKPPRNRPAFVLLDHGNGWWPYQSDDGESELCDDGMEHPYTCPYGQPGDRLWVRETWQVARETLDYETGGEYDVWEWPDELGDPRQFLNGDARFGTKAGLFYAADGKDKNPSAFYDQTGFDNNTILARREINWRPSIHMPRWASRILLEVTAVRVERLQDISEEDAKAEGDLSAIYAHASANPRGAYSAQWEQINGPGSWDDNPWVWVVEFTQVTP